MEIKEMLESYNIYIADIKTKEHQTRKLELEEVSPSSPNLSVNGDIRSKGYTNSNLEDKVIKKTDSIIRLELEIAELKAKLEMLDSIVNTLNANYKNIIELRYLKNLKLESIAITLGINISTVQRIIDKSLNKMDKIYKCGVNA